MATNSNPTLCTLPTESLTHIFSYFAPDTHPDTGNRRNGYLHTLSILSRTCKSLHTVCIPLLYNFPLISCADKLEKLLSSSKRLLNHVEMISLECIDTGHLGPSARLDILQHLKSHIFERCKNLRMLRLDRCQLKAPEWWVGIPEHVMHLEIEPCRGLRFLRDDLEDNKKWLGYVRTLVLEEPFSEGDFEAFVGIGRVFPAVTRLCLDITLPTDGQSILKFVEAISQGITDFPNLHDLEIFGMECFATLYRSRHEQICQEAALTLTILLQTLHNLHNRTTNPIRYRLYSANLQNTNFHNGSFSRHETLHLLHFLQGTPYEDAYLHGISHARRYSGSFSQESSKYFLSLYHNLPNIQHVVHFPANATNVEILLSVYPKIRMLEIALNEIRSMDAMIPALLKGTSLTHLTVSPKGSLEEPRVPIGHLKWYDFTSSEIPTGHSLPFLRYLSLPLNSLKDASLALSLARLAPNVKTLTLTGWDEFIGTILEFFSTLEHIVPHLKGWGITRLELNDRSGKRFTYADEDRKDVFRHKKWHMMLEDDEIAVVRKLLGKGASEHLNPATCTFVHVFYDATGISLGISPNLWGVTRGSSSELYG